MLLLKKFLNFHNLFLMFFNIIGKGRGRQVIAVARTADLVLMMLDATKGEIQK